MGFNTKKCLICKKPNDTLYWHVNEEKNEIWCYCTGGCQRGYDINTYCTFAGISLKEYLSSDFDLREAKPNEVNKIEWPAHFVNMSSSLAKEGVKYVESRGLTTNADIYFDTKYKGIVFPCYYDKIFCGAQTRLLKPWEDVVEGKVKKTKIVTIPGTRTGLLFYNWNQTDFPSNIKTIVVVEGGFNCIAVEQAVLAKYKSFLRSPIKVIASSGSQLTKHKMEVFKGLKDKGYKIILAPDADEAGIRMLQKCNDNDCITHYALPEDTDYDWNDYYSANKGDFLKWFIGKRVKSI
jgi:hypothetical protein